MITQQVTAIALRLLALWLLIQVILNLPSLVMIITSEQFQQTKIPMVIILGVLVCIGLVAAYFVNKAAVSVLDRANTTTEVALSGDSQKVLFQLAGLYFIVNAIAYLPRSISFLSDTLPSVFWPLGLLFQLLIGLWLVGNSTFWLNFFNKLRGRV